MRSFILPLSFFTLVCIISCNDDEEKKSDTLRPATDIQLNPGGYAPLSAELTFTGGLPVELQVRVVGKHGPASDAIKVYEPASQQWKVPVLGLYPDYDNEVIVTYFDETGSQLLEETFTIRTQPLIEEMPTVDIAVDLGGDIAAGYNLVNYFGHTGEFLPQRPFMFDRFGDIRWYLDYSAHPDLSSLFFDNGMILLQNGNLLFGNGNSGQLYEVDRLGQVIKQYSLQGYGFHHHVIEKPNGNFIVTVNDPGKPTVEDVIIEINRNNSQIVRTWDLNESLDNQRRAWPTDLADLNIDWFHANALAFDPTDNSIIVSGRTQGTVKLTENNDLVWILAPHREWETSGTGQDLRQYLLTPLDATSTPLEDPLVLDGTTNHPDFEWSWYQHSPIILPTGNILQFDNGDNRNYTGAGPYSRAVEYEIDEDKKTIRQVWTYGKERGTAAYSRIVSKVSYDEQTNHVLFTPGATSFSGRQMGRVIEIDKSGGNVVFEATVTPPIAPFSITFHNVIRVPLY